MVPLLPVYVAELGATPAVAGYYMSFSFLALATGTVCASWLSDRLQRRKALIIVGGVLSVPAVWLMGQATNIWHVTALSAIWFLLAGVTIALTSILAGLLAEETRRGRVYGILALTNPMGALAGGLTTGPIVDTWGYPTLFTVLSLFGILCPLIGLLLTDKVVVPFQRRETATVGEKLGLGGSFYLLFLASSTACVASFVFIMGRSLAMNNLGFAAAAISGAGAIGGAATLPLPPLVGWLSDRLGRKQFLTLCYLAGTASLLGLVVSVSLWHFWAVSILVSILTPVNTGVGSALVADMVPQESVGRGISLFSATTWIGAVIGFATTGSAIQALGMTTTLILGTLLTLIAAALLIPIRQDGH